MISTLANIYRHSAFTSSELETIFKAHKKSFFKKGDMFLKKGQLANEYYCLESGLVRSFAINTEGNEITTGFFGKDEIVIEVASLFLRIPTKENILALTDCECWKIDFDSFQTLFQTVNGFMEWGRAWMSGVLFTTKQRYLSMITDSATERYLALQKQHPEIIQNTPLKHIASYLGITDTSLSRIRKEVSRL
ncbi:MAG TPA: Crp/Fnr family transcriptional regulator [Ignavibacteriaceae bacterium]|nr:Crp/Fnr family transcriptional regulator [Ignavibacteriaceae bacterium]